MFSGNFSEALYPGLSTSHPFVMETTVLEFNVNGKSIRAEIVDPEVTLASYLRNQRKCKLCSTMVLLISSDYVHMYFYYFQLV